MNFSVFQQLAVALALSSLIGLDRERRNAGNKYANFGGLRTFALIGLFGALAYHFTEYSYSLFLVFTGGFLALIILSYFGLARSNNFFGATSAIAAILVYMIGVLCSTSQYVLATTITLALFSILHFRESLHGWVARLKDVEVVSTLEFMIISFVVLPLLPNKAFGPYEVLNPYLIWLMVVFISGISFVSYIAIKLFGAKRGIGITGFFAGFISSTALTLSFSAQSKKNTKVVNPYVFAIVIAGSAMFFRILAEVAVLNGELFRELLLPFSAMGLTGLVGAFWFWRRKEKVSDKKMRGKYMALKSPFTLVPALKFAFVFVIILFVSKIASIYLGERGIYAVSLFSGILNVDAITVSVSNLAKSGMSLQTAKTATIIAAMTNTFSKGVLFLVLGNRAVALKILGVFGCILVVGGIFNFL